MAEGPFRLGEWLVEPCLIRLTRGGEAVQIELKVMDVLVCLAAHAGELVERQTLIDTVWATEFISENILTRAIAELRRTLGDDAKEPKYIETIHRRGYRLIAPVEGLETVVDEEQTSCCWLTVGKRLIYLRQGENLIGRSPDADISIDAMKASRHHARITLVERLAVLEDLNSKNGTHVEGTRIERPTQLNDGDAITIGDTVLVYRIEEGPGSTLSDRDP